MKNNWKWIFGILMLLLSIVFYILHYFIFKDSHHIFLYLIGDIAFVFIEVFLVSIIIHNLLNEWEKKSHLKKINMIIETFFSEFGKQLLSFFSHHDRNIDKIKNMLARDEECEDIDFNKVLKELNKYQVDININKIELYKLMAFLKQKRLFLINLLQNPTLLEHETFSETLMSIFHITEELAARDLSNISDEDLRHTKEDFERSYKLLIRQWLNYMDYIKMHYPYFYLYAMKTNPFDEKSVWLDKFYK